MHKNLIALFSALLPAAEEIASIFIHNPNSQHKFSVIVGTVEAITPVVAAMTASVPTPAPAAVVVPAGVPSAHSSAE